MANPTKLRPWQQRPNPGDDASVAAFYDWVQTTLNTLIGQQVPPASGFDSLANPQINPASAQLASRGGRVTSTVNSITFTTTTTSITFYWDGTNGSKPLTIYRDDNTTAGPISGSLLVSGLSPSTTYFFFPFFQDLTELPAGNIQNITAEPLGTVIFASVPAANPVGSPPVAYLVSSPLVVQRQFLQDHIPLALTLSTTGVTTPAAGTGSGSGGSGGGGGGGGGGRYPY